MIENIRAVWEIFPKTDSNIHSAYDKCIKIVSIVKKSYIRCNTTYEAAPECHMSSE